MLRRPLTCHQQWYKRRKQDANCYVGREFDDPREHEQNCPCEDDDYEWYELFFKRVLMIHHAAL